MVNDVQILNGEDAQKETFAIKPKGGKSPEYRKKLYEAANLVREAFDGNRRAMVVLHEAMSTSDFPLLFGDILDRELMAQYENIAPIWQGFARRTVVRDFRAKKWYDIMGGQGILDPVGELAEYPATALTEAEYELKVAKYGKRLPLSWETFVNDDLDAFRDAPQRLAQGARDTEDWLATGLITGPAGPNTDLFGSVGTDPLSTNALTAAFTEIGQRRDSEGRPIMVRSQILMVPPALEVVALNILNATEIRQETATGQVTLMANWLRNRVSLQVNPWLSIVDTTANVDTTWYLLPAPTSPRPAIAMGFLRGHETPDLRVRADTGSRVGGGNIAPEEGSFDTDDIQYRVRHVLGGATLDGLPAFASDGTVPPA